MVRETVESTSVLVVGAAKEAATGSCSADEDPLAPGTEVASLMVMGGTKVASPPHDRRCLGRACFK